MSGTVEDMTAPPFTELDRIGQSSSGRGGARPKWFLLHTQEGNGTAESLAGYLNNSANGVSYHYTVDNGGVVVDVVDTDRASWSVLDANNRSINLCFAGSRASWGPTQWVANMGRAIDIAAYIAVQDCRKYGIPPRIITPEQLGNGEPGIADHYAVTEGLGIGSHTDVGDGFPWERFEAAVAKYASGEESPVASVWDEKFTNFKNVEVRFRDAVHYDDQYINEIHDQVAKPWPQLGTNAEGLPLTLIDAVADVLTEIAALRADVAALMVLVRDLVDRP